jgi:hypothetical protein
MRCFRPGYPSRRLLLSVSGSGLEMAWRGSGANMVSCLGLGAHSALRFVDDSPLERTRFEIRSRRERNHRRLVRGPELITGPSWSFRHHSATPVDPFARAGPRVRIRFPPAASQLRTWLFSIRAPRRPLRLGRKFSIPPHCNSSESRARRQSRISSPHSSNRQGLGA